MATSKLSSFYQFVGRNVGFILSIAFFLMAILEIAFVRSPCSTMAAVYQFQLGSCWGLIHYYSRYHRD